MDKPPAYLLWFLLRIRRHGNERDYLVRRFASLDDDRMFLEVCMLDELHRSGFVYLPEKTEKKTVQDVPPGRVADGREYLSEVPYPSMFVVSPKGHYAVRELIFSGIGTVAWTAAAAFLGGIVGAWLS